MKAYQLLQRMEELQKRPVRDLTLEGVRVLLLELEKLRKEFEEEAKEVRGI